MVKPQNLKEINKREIFILKPGSDPQKFRNYEKYLVDLDISEEISLPSSSLTGNHIENKRQYILSHEQQDFHFLDQAEITRIFDYLQRKLKPNQEVVQPDSVSSEVGIPLGGDIKPDDIQPEKIQAYRTHKMIREDELVDPKAAIRFMIYAYSNDFLEEEPAVFDLEFSHGRPKELIDFEAHIEAIQKEGYIFEDSQLTPIRKRLGLKDRKEILDYFKSLSGHFAIVCSSFSVNSHGNQSGYYELYFKHPDSDQIGTDLFVSALIPKTEVVSKFKLLYDSPKNQPFDVTIVGTIVNGLDSLTDGKYTVSMTPIAIYA